MRQSRIAHLAVARKWQVAGRRSQGQGTDHKNPHPLGLVPPKVSATFQNSHQRGTKPSTHEPMGHFIFTPYRVTKKLGTRFPETSSIGRKGHVLLSQLGSNLRSKCSVSSWQDRLLYFDMERTNQALWCSPVERGNHLRVCVWCGTGKCQGSPELAGWEHIHLKHSEPSS